MSLKFANTRELKEATQMSRGFPTSQGTNTWALWNLRSIYMCIFRLRIVFSIICWPVCNNSGFRTSNRHAHIFDILNIISINYHQVRKTAKINWINAIKSTLHFTRWFLCLLRSFCSCRNFTKFTACVFLILISASRGIPSPFFFCLLQALTLQALSYLNTHLWSM